VILEEITRYFNLENLIPCYKHTVTIACLKAIRRLQKMGHLPSNPAFFKEYAQYGVFSEVRLSAVEALVDVLKADQRKEDLDFLLDLVEVDPVLMVRHAVLRFLTMNPPFNRKDTTHPLNTQELVDRIWKMMNQTISFDAQLRCALVDFYFALFGRSRPSCLPKPELSVVLNLKEKTAVSSFSEEVDDDDFYGERNEEGPSLKRSLPPEFVSPNQPKTLKAFHETDAFKSISSVTVFSPSSRDDEGSNQMTGGNFEEGSSSTPLVSNLTPEELKKLEKKKNKDRSGSKPHKEKKKKKKKHKHKHKHKKDRKDEERKHEHQETLSTSLHQQQPQASPEEELEEGEISGSDETP